MCKQILEVIHPRFVYRYIKGGVKNADWQVFYRKIKTTVLIHWSFYFFVCLENNGLWTWVGFDCWPLFLMTLGVKTVLRSKCSIETWWKSSIGLLTANLNPVIHVDSVKHEDNSLISVIYVTLALLVQSNIIFLCFLPTNLKRSPVMSYMITLKNSELWHLESSYTQVSQIAILNSYWNMNINRLWYWERTKDLSYSEALPSEEDGLDRSRWRSALDVRLPNPGSVSLGERVCESQFI